MIDNTTLLIIVAGGVFSSIIVCACLRTFKGFGIKYKKHLKKLQLKVSMNSVTPTSNKVPSMKNKVPTTGNKSLVPSISISISDTTIGMPKLPEI